MRLSEKDHLDLAIHQKAELLKWCAVNHPRNDEMAVLRRSLNALKIRAALVTIRDYWSGMIGRPDAPDDLTVRLDCLQFLIESD